MKLMKMKRYIRIYLLHLVIALSSATTPSNSGRPPPPSNSTTPPFSTVTLDKTKPPPPPPTTMAYTTDADEDYDNVLSPEALAHLLNQTRLGPGITDEELDRNNTLMNDFLNWEVHFDIRHFGDYESFMRVCYYVSTTYRNAMRDVRKYFRIRYLYVNNVEYEVGYLTQEIIFKYQIILELFHLVRKKYGLHHDRYFALPAYMLYMYTNIVQQSIGIIHLCNMLHEIEKKYSESPDLGVFYDSREKQRADAKRANKTILSKEDDIEAYKKRREKLLKKEERERKRRQKMIDKGRFQYLTSVRTTKKHSKKYWILDYGWSIEDW